MHVTISTGIGGMLLDGRLYRGMDGAHPEIGHQVLDVLRPRCYCGARGCWEILASGPAMVSWMRDQQPGKQFTTASEICEDARRGDALALQCAEREGYYIGLGLANLITVFALDKIALGCGLMKSGSLFMNNAAASFARSARSFPRRESKSRSLHWDRMLDCLARSRPGSSDINKPTDRRIIPL